jgi:SAM-dependent methyltransferase
MPSLHTMLRWLYRKGVPGWIRELALFQHISSHVAQRVASHNELYDATYYDDVEQLVARSAPVLAASIIKAFNARRVIDVGCGTGALLGALRDRGCSCFGLEYSDAGLERCRSRGLEVRKFDLEQESLEKQIGTFDLAISMEVAEHLPPACADRLVDLLTSLSSTIVFTAATPGQGGVDHVNERPHEYWIEKYRSRGYRYELKLSEELRALWKASGVVSFYHCNLMVFRGTEENRLVTGSSS